ncbi:MAG TPA: hypothetical protein VHM65_09905, partial [Candidatus Lustribacter sp.]|nr:hypothetical protein [Candidatus Lustribacter sp.]
MSVYDHSADLSYNPSPPAPSADPPSDLAPKPQVQEGAPGSSGRREVSLVFLGASMTAGYGDPKGLGWVGRVVIRTLHPDLDLTAYNLGVRGQTSAEVMSRWRAECAPRWRGERRLVVSVGAADVSEDLSLARSRLNLANI